MTEKRNPPPVFEPFPPRRGVKSGGAALSVMILAACAGQVTVPVQADADLVIRNARVYTVDTALPWAEGVAVENGRIVAVGGSSELESWIGPETHVIDLGGRLLMPAFGDAHVHPVFGGMAFSRCSLHAGKTVEDYQATIAGCIADAPGDGVVYGVGWEDALFPPNGVPSKEILDAVSTIRPLIFESVGGHTYWVNSKALETAGISKNTPDPEGGWIDRDEVTGEPVGGLQESAMLLMAHMVPAPSAEEIQDSIVYVAHHLNSLGITSWHDAGVDLSADGTSETLSAYKAVKDRGELSAHVSIAYRWNNDFWAHEGALDQISTIIGAVEKAKSWGLHADSVKFYLDGVIPQRTAAMIEPYEGSEVRGALQIAPDVLAVAVTQLSEAGIQSHVHAIGDLGVRVALDAFEEALEATGQSVRPVISHLNVIDPADQARFGPLGAIAGFQPTWASNYPYMDLTKQAIGPVRSGYLYPSKGVVDSGAKIAFGSDWPVATADPLLGLQVAVTRTNYEEPDSDPLLPDQAITLEQAIRSHTIDVAFALGLDATTGSVTVGKSADLIVLDANIFTLPAERVSDADVILTLFEGRPVYGTLDQFE